MSDYRHSGADADLARLSSVNLNLLVPLLALLEERSVTRAAARVGLSQPAMSHALGRMRRMFGDELVVRQGAGVVLTPRAVELIEPLRQALLQTASVLNPDDGARAARRVITVPMTVNAAFVIGSRLSALLSVHSPDATLRLRTVMSPSEASFTDDRFDLMLLSDEYASHYPRERLYEDRWVVIASADSPADASALELLTTLPHVALDSFPQQPHPYAILEERKVSFSIRDFVSDSLLIPQQVAGTGGVAIHQHRVAVVMQSFFNLRIEEFPFPAPKPSVDIVWNPWLADEQFRSWMRGLLLEAASPKLV